MQCTSAELIAKLHYQIGALQGIYQAQGISISYVKPHGSLYNDMMRDQQILRSVLEAVSGYDAGLPLMVLPGPITNSLKKPLMNSTSGYCLRLLPIALTLMTASYKAGNNHAPYLKIRSKSSNKPCNLPVAAKLQPSVAVV